MANHPARTLKPLVALVVIVLWEGCAFGLVKLTANQTQQSRAVALTFDDLPYVQVDQSDYVRDASRVTDEILRVLRLHHSPAVAFVNEGQLHAADPRSGRMSAHFTVQTQEVDARTAILRRWADAGVVLGNHTYSHADFNTLTTEQFEDEIIRGDVVTRRLMESHRPYQRYFRHPYTHTGDTQAKKEAVEVFLTARGYKVAPHTIENSDFLFNAPYVRARRSNNGDMEDKLKQAYLDFTISATAFAEQITPRVFDRNIPQTLLIHSNDITADMLDELLTRLEGRGYRFITLDEAMKDDAYQTTDTLVTQWGQTWLWRWMKSKGMKVSFKDDPDPPAWVSELYSKP